MRKLILSLTLMSAALAVAPGARAAWPSHVGQRLRGVVAGSDLAAAATVAEDGRIVGTALQRALPVRGALALPLAMAVLDAAGHGRMRDDASLRRDLRRALPRQDPAAQARLLARLGGAGVLQAYLQDLGVEGIWVAPGPRLHGRATPLALLTVLERAEHGAALDARARRRLHGLLQTASGEGAAMATWSLRSADGRRVTALGVARLPDGRHLELALSVRAARASALARAGRWLWQAQLAPTQRLALGP